MKIIEGADVNELWSRGYRYLKQHGARAASRAGPVVVAPCPVMSVYERPRDRVLTDPARDANPFFHLMESLWMLGGRDDAAFLDRYVSDFGARFAEPDGRIHGAYGRRWRTAFGSDQLDAVVARLRANPYDRQCVIQMWDCRDSGSDPEDAMDDLGGSWRDRPCNTHVYLRVRQRDPRELGIDTRNMNPDGSDFHLMSHLGVLDLTVCCRSNDIVWGAYGANAVHFSMLQEYLAGRIGVGVGIMYQLSNNYHAYADVFERLPTPPEHSPYGEIASMPIGDVWDEWDNDLYMFLNWHDLLWNHGIDMMDEPDMVNVWFHVVAAPVARARYLWKGLNKTAALAEIERVEAHDWHQACRAWMVRRPTR